MTLVVADLDPSDPFETDPATRSIHPTASGTHRAADDLPAIPLLDDALAWISTVCAGGESCDTQDEDRSSG
jgi:hypothetical protein